MPFLGACPLHERSQGLCCRLLLPSHRYCHAPDCPGVPSGQGQQEAAPLKGKHAITSSLNGGGCFYQIKRNLMELFFQVKHTKFNESGQLLAFYLVSLVWAGDIVLRENLLSIRTLWEGYPHTNMTFMFKFFFIVQASLLFTCLLAIIVLY